ncbi:MAG TPA: nicotinate (nicotinamide) nucleotide adenylyltransferase [Terracidiphilus sp.]|nr:nicotinate (nicotinamide) nucleotide adenylyltransferase [Terracidiphilus sp.]
MSQPLSRDRRVAFFGGSFDPPHVGHLSVARAACVALGLDRVLFAPVGAQPLKADGATADFEDRVAMTGLAIAGEPKFAVSLADAPKASGAPNYTVETLERLRGELPQGCRLYCLMGADSLAGLRQWHRAAEIPFAAAMVVASRPGESLNDLQGLLPVGLTMEDADCAELPESDVEVRCYQLEDGDGRRAAFYVLPGLDVAISATAIRARVAEGGISAERTVLPDAVSEYIRTHGLYR